MQHTKGTQLDPDIQVVSIYLSQCEGDPNILSIFLLPYKAGMLVNL